jgi:DNA-binding NarL/FixJ family response regulator
LNVHGRGTAELATTGLTNAAIGPQMFLSRRAVEPCVRKVFSQLGSTSRSPLCSVLRGLEIH